MTPRVVHIKLHPVPRALPEVHLERVIVAVGSRGQPALRLANGGTGRIGISLENVERVRARRRKTKGWELTWARGEGRAHQIANVRHGSKRSSQLRGEPSGCSLVQIVDERTVRIVLTRSHVLRAAAWWTRERRVEEGQGCLPSEPQVGEVRLGRCGGGRYDACSHFRSQASPRIA